MAEDLIFITSDEAAYAELPDALATGSSRMPHKKNPDVLELTRGHAARAIGELTGFLALLKGLPLAYNKDLQLDKEPLFRTRTTLALLLPTLTALVGGTEAHAENVARPRPSPLLLATDAADTLAATGIPFREAHEIVGRQGSVSTSSVEGSAREEERRRRNRAGPGDARPPARARRLSIRERAVEGPRVVAERADDSASDAARHAPVPLLDARR